jgi:hypothetical protein
MGSASGVAAEAMLAVIHDRQHILKTIAAPHMTGMVKLAPSLTPEGQRAVTVLVLV